VIIGKQFPDITKIYSDQMKVRKGAANEKAGQTAKPDEVVLSPAAQEFGQYIKALQGMSDVRDDKVKELAAEIASGRYQRDAREIAGRMLKSGAVGLSNLNDGAR